MGSIAGPTCEVFGTYLVGCACIVRLYVTSPFVLFFFIINSTLLLKAGFVSFCFISLSLLTV